MSQFAVANLVRAESDEAHVYVHGDQGHVKYGLHGLPDQRACTGIDELAGSIDVPGIAEHCLDERDDQLHLLDPRSIAVSSVVFHGVCQ